MGTPEKNNIDVDAIKRDSVGRWPGLFRALGVEVREDGKHGPCPMCGGERPFRMDDSDGRGTWICTHCGAGDGFRLLQKVMKLDFIGAITAVSEVLGGCPKNIIPREPTMTREAMRKIFQASKPATQKNAVGTYLRSRGLQLCPGGLRFHPTCWEPETKKTLPAMLAIFTSPDGEALTMHRTYLGPFGKADIEKPKKILPSLKPMAGGAVRLFEPSDGKICLAEGIETAIAVTESTSMPCWAALSASLLAEFSPPKGIKEVMIFGDNDQSFTGQRAAYMLANRLVVQNKISASVYLPRKIGTDFLDEYLEEKHD